MGIWEMMQSDEMIDWKMSLRNDLSKEEIGICE